MAFNQDKYTSLIKAKIAKYAGASSYSEEGKVISIADGIALVSGLDEIMLNEIVEFSNGTKGMALNLENSYVGVVLFGTYDDIKEKSSVKRTKTVVSVPVGNALLGRVVNPLGKVLDGKSELTSSKTSPVEKVAPGVMKRSPVDTPLETGILVIDSMFPIGRGQRELIIGDRQTGKTSTAVDAIINQKGKDVKCVYVSIGQKNSSLAHLIQNLEAHGALEYTTIVASTASDLPAFKYLAPYSGITIAEEWMNKGEDVLIVFDDLSKHAVAYRTISLLLRRPAGREAYPGDIFYLHSRLLERSCKLDKAYGGGSITALPIVETQNSDISGYIPTNTISITDGQLFLQSNLFNLGQRPAIDVGLSVSRVGSSAQYKAMKQVSGSLKIDLSQYYEMSSFAQFGNDLDASTKNIIDVGVRIVEMAKQNLNDPMAWTDQAVLLCVIKLNMIKYVPIDKMAQFKEQYTKYIRTEKIYSTIKESKEIKDADFTKLTEIISTFVYSFIKTITGYPEVLMATFNKEYPGIKNKKIIKFDAKVNHDKKKGKK